MRLAALLLVVAVAGASTLSARPAVAADGCGSTSWFITCEPDNDGSSVSIGGSFTQPGSGNPAPEPPAGDGGGGWGGQEQAPGVDAEPAPVVTDPRWGPCRDDQQSPRSDGLCWQDWAAEDEGATEEAFVPVIPAVTVSDVVRFAPATPTVGTEPDGVAVVGMPMNVVVSASVQTVHGELFGLPVSVTFTPIDAIIDYGDGTTSTVPIGGGTWEQLGQPDFTPTATSHAFAERGFYTLSTTVRSAAIADFGVWGTRPVEGLVASAPSTAQVQAVTADTGLVKYTCAEHPAGPGC